MEDNTFQDVKRFIEEIQQENKWRFQDFAQIKFILNNLNSSDNKSEFSDPNLFTRMSVIMIYAHWEGYIVSCKNRLISYLNKLELNFFNTPTNLIVISLSKHYGYLKSKQSFDQKIKFTDDFKAISKEKLKFDNKNISAKSNLNFEVLQETCGYFSFNINKFQAFKSDLEQLVKIRNNIAHGENAYVLSQAQIAKYIELVEKLTNIFLLEIETFVENKHYLIPELR